MIRKKIFGLLVLTITTTGWSQEFKDVMRYEYTMTFKPTIGSDIVKKENVFLDVWDNSSRFATEERVKFIEFNAMEKTKNFRGNNIVLGDRPSSGQNWVIQKEKSKVSYFSTVGLSNFKTIESLNTIVWNISTEINNYEGMKVQKATTNLGGRSWTVWFTQEIPLIDGPYKFKNLPGFVVKAASEDGDYLFEFTKSEKTQTILKYIDLEDAMVIKESELKKLREIAANKSYTQLLAEKGITIVSGFSVEREQEMNRKVGDSNNYIEKL